MARTATSPTDRAKTRPSASTVARAVSEIAQSILVTGPMLVATIRSRIVSPTCTVTLSGAMATQAIGGPGGRSSTGGSMRPGALVQPNRPASIADWSARRGQFTAAANGWVRTFWKMRKRAAARCDSRHGRREERGQ